MTSLQVFCGLAPPPNQKFWLRLWLQWLHITGYTATVTSDDIDQVNVRLFFGLELVLVMIRVGAAEFRL